MKPIYLVLAILASVAMVTMGTHQVYAPRDCAGCSEFKKLTTEFEKDVLDAAQPPPDNDKIQMLLDDYRDAVMRLFPPGQ